MSCTCELVPGEWSTKHPRSQATLRHLSGPEWMHGCVDVTEYECTQCGAKLVHYAEDRAAPTWDRSPKPG